ncbi:Pre-rRNA-processing protein TSR2 [Echria macrotheca]|uniref:Pre-rRNA-processing protein TSR2 n=1 Tax=Echria macrotheca TaxID=438768 RepID=A0AAJ0F5G8_9PEZI|nr:Pre-rRNA-processing protein TSR2 [Echria macrotheca]
MASSNPSSAEGPTPATCQSNFEQGVACALHLWPALTLAVQNNWGGADSSDKRDWFAGAIVDLFPDLSAAAVAPPAQSSAKPPQPQNSSTTEEPDQVDIETVLLQVMLDEFEVNVDDDSAFEVAEQIMRVRAECLRGKFDEVAALQRRFEARKGTKVVGVLTKAEGQDEETDWDTDDDDESDEGEDDDVDMDDAPPAPKEKEAPEVDEEGFTKVTRKKR